MRFGLRRTRVIVFLGGFWLLIFLFALPVLRLQNPPPGPRNYLQFIPMLTLPAVAFVLVPAGTYLAARKQWQTAPNLREPREYTFTDDGIRVVGATFAAFVAWSNITIAQRAGGQVLLGTGQQFFLIPLWAFGTDDEAARFRERVTVKLNDSRL